MLDDNGFSVKGCNVIYPPRGQAGEYAKLAVNHYKNCGHKCVYCYVPKVTHTSREEFDSNPMPREGLVPRLIEDAVRYRDHGLTEQVMLSFTTDPYHHADKIHGLTRTCLKILAAHGLGFCTLTKGGQRALRDIDLFRPTRDAFASTLTTLRPEQSLEWEPAASLPKDRCDTLKAFHNAGIFTWVSLEPVYDTEMTMALIKETAGYVDLYKIGRINYHRITREIDWRAFTDSILKLVNDLGKKHYIKLDLQPYLPKGYDNPRYIRQAHGLTHHPELPLF